ncbi:MAG: glycosyltransferase family 39 protein, partial [Candidatus Omnitrophica bacterium]|nr:glycosyltransferase family 39 protein [Candidatus Omnitrophota bacterium]
LYPMMLLLSKKLFGTFGPLIILQKILLAVLILSWGIFLFFRYSELVAYAFMFFVSIAPLSVFYAAVLYPDIPYIFFIASSLLLLVEGIQKRSIILPLFSGILFGCGVYARGLYLLLPFVLVATLGIGAKRKIFNLDSRGLSIFLSVFILMVSPWLLRNITCGVYGMNAMWGYTLGYTYGELPSGERSLKDDPQALAYDEYVRRRGSDAGTNDFIMSLVDQTHIRYAEADKIVIGIVLKKMISHPWRVGRTFIRNIWVFPSRIMGDFFRPFSEEMRHDPSLYRIAYLGRTPVRHLLDVLFMAIAVVGVIARIRLKDTFAYVTAVTLLYVMAVTTTIVYFDIRYRGVVDLLLYPFTVYGVMALRRFLKNILSLS